MNILTLASKKDNPIAMLIGLLKKLKISVHNYTTKNKLNSHPSLFSLSNQITSWFIPNQALKLDKGRFSIEKLPFIAMAEVAFIQMILVNGNKAIDPYCLEHMECFIA